MPIIGAHVSVAGGLFNAFKNAEKIGATALQFFGASPQQWKAPLPTPEVIEKYKQEQKRTGLGPVFLHAPYLINLATPKRTLWHASLSCLAGHLRIAEAIGATGVIFHIGSWKDSTREEGIAKLVKGIKEVLKNVPGNSYLIMENAAGGGNKLGYSPEEVGEIFHLVGDPRVKVCLDTQHAFAAGIMKSYDPDEIKELVKNCDKAFGWDNVVAFHLNDSKTASGSSHDRHENIGEGMIGRKGFENLAANKKTASLPWILEVPGFTGSGPDKENIEILKKIVGPQKK